MVARQAHNLEIAGSNPASATILRPCAGPLWSWVGEWFSAARVFSRSQMFTFAPCRRVTARKDGHVLNFQAAVKAVKKGTPLYPGVTVGRDRHPRDFCGIALMAGSAVSCERETWWSSTLSPEQSHAPRGYMRLIPRSSNPPFLVVDLPGLRSRLFELFGMRPGFLSLFPSFWSFGSGRIPNRSYSDSFHQNLLTPPGLSARLFFVREG